MEEPEKAESQDLNDSRGEEKIGEWDPERRIQKTLIYTCQKCGHRAEAHQIGRMNVPVVIFQCEKCCFILDIKPLKEVLEYMEERSKELKGGFDGKEKDL